VRRASSQGFTAHVFDTLQPGALLRIEGPLGQFWLRLESPRPVVMIGGGTGYAPLRAMLSGTRRSTGRRGAPAHRQRQRPPRLSRYSVAHAQARSSDPTVAGRWSALPAAEPESTVRAHFQAELLLNRYGVLTKGAVGAEEVPGGFAMLYKVLTAFEDAGRCQRGYFV